MYNPDTMYRITATHTINRVDAGGILWPSSSRQVTSFYLRAGDYGLRSAEDAERIARRLLGEYQPEFLAPCSTFRVQVEEVQP